MDRIWTKSYPSGITREIDLGRYTSVAHVCEEACRTYPKNIAFRNMGVGITYAEFDRLTEKFAAFLQKDLGLKKGDRLAIQMPNLLQYPVALYGAIRAGVVIVNTNPLYTPREMKFQFKDSGATAILILANFASKLEEIIAETDIKHVIVTEIGDLFPQPKKWVTNLVVKKVKKMVPAFSLKHISFNEVMERGSKLHFDRVKLGHEDLAFLQYTGGTTGVSKGAMLTHRNIVANCEQMSQWLNVMLRSGAETVITALPLYHIFSLTVNCIGLFKEGMTNVLITNPKDIPGFIKELQKENPTVITVVNTLLIALLNHPDFPALKMPKLKISVAGGMALQSAVAERWMKATGTPVIEGYGLTEASPAASCNPLVGKFKLGTIGLPLPSTDIKLIDESGKELGIGEPGEISVKGPQVMRGYWNQPEETRAMIDDEGWLKTGDIAQIDSDGFIKIVDRKKDMILVSGFNVYPNEIEDVLIKHPGVAEVAAVGVPDEKSGESVKVFVVKKNPKLEAKELMEFAKTQLTQYKVPRHVEFRTELPKNNVGKILRRMLRET